MCVADKGSSALCAVLSHEAWKTKLCVSFVGIGAPRRPLSSEVVCAGGLTGRWTVSLPVTCSTSVSSLRVPQTFFSYSRTEDWEGSFSPPQLCMPKATFGLIFSSCDSPD